MCYNRGWDSTLRGEFWVYEKHNETITVSCNTLGLLLLCMVVSSETRFFCMVAGNTISDSAK